MRIVRVAFVLAVAVLSGATVAHAQKRVALVIGNGAYTKVPRLDNPRNDAAAIEAMFKASGFNPVVRANDLGVAAMRRALRDFSDTAQDADVAVIFYAGHGIEVAGVNYLIPIDAVLQRDIDAQDEAVSLDRLNQILEPVKRLRLVILDACRDNPFARSMRRTISTRSVRSGYGDIDERSLPTNTLVAYAQRAGATAEDGVGSKNSPYTSALLKHLPTPGLDVELALRRVRDEVLRSTNNRQEPFKYGSLGGSEIALVARPEGLAQKIEQIPISPLAQAAADWDTLRTKNDIAELEAFAQRHKGTYFADLAKTRIDHLKRTQTISKTYTFKKEEERKRAETTEQTGLIEKPSTLSPKPGVPARPVNPMTADEERSLKPKDIFKECDHCPEMVVVPAGQFLMGSPEGEEGRETNEGPQHQMTVAKPFAAGKFEVTFAEWDACVAESGCKHKPDDSGWGRGKRPVINVSWDQITNEYLPWLSRKTGKTYRLLTEAEWEYAARAGTTTPFSTGKSITSGQANFDGTYGGGKGAHRQKTVDVGSFPANAFGLHDMHGNVWEWVADCYVDKYFAAFSDSSGAVVSDGCGFRVQRGGGWSFDRRFLRSAFRLYNLSNNGTVGFGFRVARTLN